MTRVLACVSLIFFAFALAGCTSLFRAERLVPIAAAPPSQGLVYGGLLFTTGFVPRDPVTGAVAPGGITAQTHVVLDNLEAALKRSGCSLKDVVELSVYLTDAADLAQMNAVMEARFGDHKPARTTVPIAQFQAQVLLEVDLVARVP